MADREIKLLATDFDGTIFYHGGGSVHYASLADRIRSLQRTYDCKWLVCTGRSLRSLRGATVSMNRSGIAPDFVLVRHRWLVARRGGTWFPHVPLILSFYAAQREHTARLSRVFGELTTMMRHEFHRARVARSASGHLTAILRSQEDFDRASGLIRERLEEDRSVRIATYGREINVIVLPHEKAIAVQCVAGRLEIPKDNILSIGDARSDIYMLSPSISGMAGCPANARPQVIGAVLARKGHIASDIAIEGSASIIQAYIDGNVRSEPPPNWQEDDGAIDLSQMNQPTGEPVRRQRREALLIVATVVVGFLAVCSSGIIPYGDLVLKPISFLMRLVADLFN